MVLIDFARFLAYLLIAGVVLRLAEGKLAGSAIGDALAFAY